MRNIIRKLGLVLAMLIAAIPCRAYDFIVDGICYGILSDTDLTCEVMSSYGHLEKYKGDIVIPSSVDFDGKTFKVTKLGDNCFYECYSLTSIEIPESVTELGDECFYECEGLTSIEIPESVTKLGDKCFGCCRGLTSIEIPDSVTKIGDSAFASCYKLSHVTIGNSVESIGVFAFYNLIENVDVEYASLESLCKIKFGNGDSNPLNGDLYINGELIEELVIPESITSIGNYTFRGATSITSVVIPGTVTTIGKEAFYGCTGMTSIIIPNSVTKIGAYAFQATSSLRSIELPNSVRQIGMAAFEWSGIESVVLSNSLSVISEDLFFSCHNLTSVEIPNSVKYIYSAAFEGCDKLTTVVIGNSVTTIRGSAFLGCVSLEEIILPPSVKEIYGYAFSFKKGDEILDNVLRKIVMGPNITEIGDHAFYGSPDPDVYITAQTPPTLGANALSSYWGSLYVQGEAAANKYETATRWKNFGPAWWMVEPTEIIVEGGETLSGKAGDTFQLTAKLLPENVTLPYVFWRSSNPNIAYVENDGLVTLRIDVDENLIQPCTIYAESLYANGPVKEIQVKYKSHTGMDNIVIDTNVDHEIDYNETYSVFNINGSSVGSSIDGLAPGMYIVRQGASVKKIAVK